MNFFSKRQLTILLAAFILASCSAAQRADNAIPDKWEMWEGRGNVVINDDSLIYYAVNLQDEEYDYDIEGRGPALIAAKKIKGKKWILDVKSLFFSNDKVFNRFSMGIWIGNPEKRPNLASKDAELIVSVTRTRGGESRENSLRLEIRNGKNKETVEFPTNTQFFRFQREKNELTIYYSGGFKPKYEQAYTVSIPSKAELRFFAGARYDGVISGKPRMVINSLTLNDKNFLE